MNDFRIFLQVKDGKLDVMAEDDSAISIKDLAETCGILYLLIGDICMRKGADLEQVKDSLTDMHQASILQLMMLWDDGSAWNS